MNIPVDPFTPWVLTSTLVFVAAFVFSPYVKRLANWFVTIVHEAGHGIFSLLTRGRIHAIKLHSNGSGSTATSARQGLFSRFTRIIVLFAGYATPIYLGFGLLVLNLNLQTLPAFYVLLGIGLLTLIFLRSWFGIIILGCYFLFLVAGIGLANGIYLGILINFFALLFLLQGIVDVVKIAGPVFNKNRYQMSAESDFHILEQESLFNIPAQVWYVVFVLMNTATMFFLILWAI